MHQEAYDAVAQLLQTIPRPTRVVEFGSRNINGTVRPLIPASVPYLGVDLQAGTGVDVIADVRTFNSVPKPDLVLCCEVLEHCPEPERLVANALRLLAPGGSLVLTCATDPRPPHGAETGGALAPGEYYANVDEHDMVAWLASAGAVDVSVQVRPDRGDLYVVASKPPEVAA